MGKKRAIRRTQNSKFQVLKVNAILSLGALAAETAIVQALTQLADDFWAQSCDLSWAWDSATAGDGPIGLGIANGDLSVAEIKEAVNASPVSRSDIVNREHARRPIRQVGQLFGVAGSSMFMLQDGKQVRTKIAMYMAEGTELNAYVFNLGGVALTTGSAIRIYGNIYGEWR